MATYVLVHGGGHGGWCFRPLARILSAARAEARVVDGIELVLFPGTGPMPYYGVTDPDTISWMHERLTPHPWACFEQPLRLANEEELWKIPQTQIVCTRTLSTRDTARIAKAKDAGRLWDVDTGHDLMITEPETVAELLPRVVSETGSSASGWRRPRPAPVHPEFRPLRRVPR